MNAISRPVLVAERVTASPPVRRPVGRSGYLVAVVLGVIYTFNFLDRQLLTVLAQPVKHALSLTDLQLGLLTGIAFALFYTVFGIPIAALSDRVSRVKVVACACAIWSLFSAACGVTTGFATLALARMGVGLGEAGCSPASFSILSDYFPPHKRGLALSIYSVGAPFGTMLGAAGGALIAARFGWRVTFLVIGACGLILVPLLLGLVREPPRGVFDRERRLNGPPELSAKRRARPSGFSSPRQSSSSRRWRRGSAPSSATGS